MCPMLNSLGRELLQSLQRLEALDFHDFAVRADIFAHISDLHSAIRDHRNSCPRCREMDFLVHQSFAQTVQSKNPPNSKEDVRADRSKLRSLTIVQSQ